MEVSRNKYLKNALGATALVLSLAALQGPLWRPAVPPRHFTAKPGGTVLFDYGRDMIKASILQKGTASITSAGPHQLAIHGHVPGRTALFIKYSDGETKMYEVVVLPS